MNFRTFKAHNKEIFSLFIYQIKYQASPYNNASITLIFYTEKKGQRTFLTHTIFLRSVFVKRKNNFLGEEWHFYEGKTIGSVFLT